MKAKTKKLQKRKLKKYGRKVKAIKRTCLCCEDRFLAVSKFQRLCVTCRKRFAYYNVDEEAVLGIRGNGKTRDK